jgi:CBS domain-containing protein
MTVEKIMSDKGTCLAPDMKLKNASTILDKERLHAVLVVDKGKCLGILSAVEMSKVKRTSQYASVKAFMRRNLPTIGPDQGIKEALGILSDTGVPMLPVVRDDGQLLGKVTRTDLMLQIYDLG